MSQPIFVIGLNRSGTSLLASLLGQHTDLELVAINKKPTYNKQYSTSGAYAEVSVQDQLPHWRQIITSGITYWASKENLKYNYITDVDDKLAKQLILDMERLRKTNKRPIYKQPHFALKLKLIKKLYPHAQLVWIIRDIKNYAESNVKRGYNKEKLIDHYWNGTNIILQDIKEFDYTITYLSLLQMGGEITIKEMNRIFNFLHLPFYEVNIQHINKKYTLLKDI